MTNRYKPNEPACPTSLELLTKLLQADEVRVGELVQQLSMMQRASLATYCIARCHMRDLGLLVASHCSENALWAVAGAAGRILFEQAQDRASFDPGAASPFKRKVTLARAA